MATYLSSEQWGMIIVPASHKKGFKAHFERHPKAAIEKYFPEWGISKHADFRIFRVPDNPGDIDDLKEIVLGTKNALAIPYTCCC